MALRPHVAWQTRAPAWKRSRVLRGLWLSAALFSLACASTPVQPPGRPPTPASVNRHHPGGDAYDPHEAALQRLLEEPWKRQSDRDWQIRVPLRDRKNWRRTHFWLIDHFTGFRYGDDVHALNVVFVQDIPEGQEPTNKACMHQLEKWADPQLKNFDVRMGPVATSTARWRKRDLLVRTAYASVDYGFGRESFSLAWAAYPAYPKACLIFSLAIPWRGHKELADRVREQWIAHGLKRLKPLTKTRPYRKPKKS